MKLGFVSAILPELSLDQVLAFAKANAFACVEAMCWPVGKAERKFAGVTHVSEKDIRPNDAEETHHTWVMAGQRTAAALKAKGYHQRFVFSLATGHCDGRVFQKTLADTLVWTWRGYHAE